MQIDFSTYTCTPRFGVYSNGRTAIQLLNTQDGAPVATVTVNLDGVEIGPEEVAVKVWSENAGMLEACVKAGLVSEPIRHETLIYPTHKITVPICKLLVKQ